MAERARRADAVGNRDRIVAAAREALAAGGPSDELRLHLVAKAAGVGQGTLYRHFPTREHLLAAAYRDELGELVHAVPALLAEHAPIDALARWLDRVVDYARVKRGVMAAIAAGAWADLYADNHTRLDDALTLLLERGQAAGEVRDGVEAADVFLLSGSLTNLPEDQWEPRARKLTTMIVDGLRVRQPASGPATST